MSLPLRALVFLAVLLGIAGCPEPPDSGDSQPADSVGTDTSFPETGDTVETGETNDSVDSGGFVLPEGIDAVILISDDTVRHDMVDAATQPGFNARMEEGIVATSFWVAGDWTRGTMPPVITGRTGPNIGSELYQDQGPFIPETVPTLAETFVAAGWKTFGDNSNSVWGSQINGTRGYQTLTEAMGIYPTEGFRSAADQFDRALAWFATTEGPKFLHIHTMDAHDRYSQLAASCKDNVATLDAACPLSVTTADMNSVDMAGYSEADVNACRVAVEAAHRCTATFLDESFENFMISMDEAGYLEHTLVIKVPDHGEFWGEGFPGALAVWNHHRLMYAQVSRGFLWVWWKGAPHVEVTQATTQADVMPTILTFAGIDIPEGVDGSCVTDLPPNRVVTQYAVDSAQSYHGAVSADGSRHLILNVDPNGNDVWGMYDPQSDPDEQTPLTDAAPEDLLNAIEAQRAQTQGFGQ